MDGDEYKAYLHSAPADGQANEELVRLLSRHFGVPKLSVAIVRGAKSRLKEVEVGE